MIEVAITPEGQLQAKEESVFEPNSNMLINDGLEAAFWAMLFCEWGSERAITTWANKFKLLYRKYPNMLQTVKQAWDSCM